MVRWPLRMAEEYSLLEGHPGEQCRYLRHCSNSLRHCRWHCSRGRRRTLIVELWDTESLTRVQGFKASIRRPESVAFDPTGSRIVSGSLDNAVRILDSSTGQILKTLTENESWATSVAFSPDGRKVASGTWNGPVRIWDANSGSQLQVLRQHAGHVNSVEFSPDGSRILSAGSDGVFVWDVTSGKLELSLPNHGREFMSAGFSPDGKMIVTASSDKTVKIWSSRSGKELRTLTGH